MNKLKRTAGERAELLAYLRRNYTYEPDGFVRRLGKDKPVKGSHKKPNRRNPNPYIFLDFRINGVRHFLFYHQAVWLVCKGCWPDGQLDHLNGNPKDNRIENLRDCSARDNRMNTLCNWKPNAVTGVPGVVSEKHGGFLNQIRGKKYYFRNPYEAFWVAMVCGKKYKRE